MQDAQMAEFLLGRFRRVLALKRKHDEELNESGKQLLAAAGFAAYTDLLDAGFGFEALKILQTERALRCAGSASSGSGSRLPVTSAAS